MSLGARPITDADLARCIGQAVASVRLPGRRAIHLRPIAWAVDGQKGVKDPRDMFGRALGLELLVVSMNEGMYQTLGHCVERAHLSFEGVVASPFASALAALEEDEMDLGAICIDMGGGSTSVAVYAGGSLVHVDSLAVGGQHVTQDVARGLSTSIAGAERIKTLHGSAIASSNEDREMIEAPPRGDDPGAGPVVAPRSLLKGIIAPRVEETLELLRERLKASGAPIEPGAGIVLIGGASQLAGVREVAVRVFDRPVRLGRPRRLPHLADAASGPAFCAAAGVLHRAAFGPREAGPKIISQGPHTSPSTPRPTSSPRPPPGCARTCSHRAHLPTHPLIPTKVGLRGHIQRFDPRRRRHPSTPENAESAEGPKATAVPRDLCASSAFSALKPLRGASGRAGEAALGPDFRRDERVGASPNLPSTPIRPPPAAQTPDEPPGVNGA